MTPVVTFILFLIGTNSIGDSKVVIPIASFDDRDTCEIVRGGLTGFPVPGASNSFVCLESTEIHKLTQ